MTTVDLVYDADCPNVQAARANLLRAFVAVGRKPWWREYRIGAEDLPDHARGYGSPTILVDRRDVGGTEPGSDACCRLYPGSPGAPGVPLVEQIRAALLGAGAGAPPAAAGRSWRATFAVVPGIGLALLPKVACPACWPAYAGFLSSLGLGFLMDTAWLLPLTAMFLVVAVGALGFRARRRRGLGPFAVGLAAAAVVLVGLVSSTQLAHSADADGRFWLGGGTGGVACPQFVGSRCIFLASERAITCRPSRLATSSRMERRTTRYSRG